MIISHKYILFSVFEKIENTIMKAYDIILTLYLRLYPMQRQGMQDLADLMGGMSLSLIHKATKRLEAASVISRQGDRWHVSQEALHAICVHSVRYFFPVKPGEQTRGIPTAHSSGLLQGLREGVGVDYVWPSADSKGTIPGAAVAPLHASVYDIIKNEPEDKIYQALTYIDCFRVARAREKNIAEQQFAELIK